MIYDASIFAVVLFIAFVIAVLGISRYFASRTKSSAGYYAAGGTIHWGVNGIAFAGDYLSAASFLGICGMIAFMGYDGFLYSIGYLAGWVVALFVVAEPLKRAGKYTFTDALDSRFNSKAIQLTAAISTLVVSICYLIPQMVGAGALITPLLGLPHWVGVTMVGSIVIFIVATAGMASTTYVQFIKGFMLIIFSTVLTIALLVNGYKLQPQPDYHDFQNLNIASTNEQITEVLEGGYNIVSQNTDIGVVKLEKDGIQTWWQIMDDGASVREVPSKVTTATGLELYNGEPREARRFYQVGHMSKIIVDGEEVDQTGPVGPFEFLSILNDSEVVLFTRTNFTDAGDRVSVWLHTPTPGEQIMRPGVLFKIDSGRLWDRINFISLMLALFFGTSALPHILIRYYTVPSPKDARKSTIVAIGAIGFFYILTLYMGLGAMTHGVLDVESSNMSAPLLAKSFGVALFACISAVAFATVLGTVSGLIVAASGAVAHDLLSNFAGIKMSDAGQVKAGKMSAIVVGIIAIILGILFQGMNVSFLVGLAFSVAASANLPAIVMVIFWKKTSAIGVAVSVMVGMLSSLFIILLSPSMYDMYGLDPASAPMPIDQPGIISIPLSFITLVVFSLLFPPKRTTTLTEAVA